ncbi:MAG: RpiB/LacA/LacB family sugar-phosphate isomerase [Rickettsiales bacterium]|jgi:ribose 5-phosphate isomerase B|nr:RpiB/LacA/LacB family sugar-phosphate isomerase [Rickettsiales bacterium]
MPKINNLYIASDHAGYKLKSYLIANLATYNIINLGTDSVDPVDYPDYAKLLAYSVKAEGDFGILICGSGIGISIAANRYSHIRAALCDNVELAKLSREHNNANVLALGARFVDEKKASEISNMFLNSEFAVGRHSHRVSKLSL